ncbi:M12 family metallo-peptidase [Nostoc sp.]|uniref:M12 family metallo-peptidase n=1 Tax=Nostoc sp. TaxID=1180 RepID=UPI002FF62CF4
MSVSAFLDLSKTFFLNSLLGANQTIYLDFDGNITSGTSWNTSERPANIITPAFDFDGNTASFSSAELETIQYIWQRVAEDFSPFNVNVTTQAPADINDLIKSGSNDTRWGVRVAIGGSSYDWYGKGVGGVTKRGSFNWDSDTPAFVFAENAINGDEKYTADAISHEVGHMLGLEHDGQITPAEDYYEGHGSGETGWAPIMGSAYYQNLTQWSKGEYASANNTEDDLQIITTQNGFTYRADDCGDTIATAKLLTVSGTSISDSGIIERNTDLDFYSFVTDTGLISLIVNPFSRGPNLDILAELYNSAGTLIASSNPTDLLSASITANVVAGNYYLKIDGIGKENPLSTGYTDYGSLGQYFISGTLNFPNIERWATGQGGFWDTQKWLVGDFNADGKDDLVNVFNDGGLASIDTHLSNGESFDFQRSATGQGGFWDTQKWLVGDFNADGKDDLVNVFNDGGLASIDTHLSNGESFNIQRWATGQGGFWDTQKWLVGDFNADGKDDLVNVFNDGGLASIDTHLSNGESFNIQRSATGQGGFWDTQKWLVGDFNADGKDDLVNVFNDGGLASIDTHLSNGESFDFQRSATGQGGFWDTQKWLVGDFNADRKDDLVNVFNDGGLASIDAHLSNGESFDFQRWVTGQGGFRDTQKWLVGNFNADGRDDLVNVFNDGGLASIDILI